MSGIERVGFGLVALVFFLFLDLKLAQLGMVASWPWIWIPIAIFVAAVVVVVVSRGVKDMWRSRHDVPVAGEAVATVARTAVDRGDAYTIVIGGGPRAGTYEVKARWYDNPTTIAWKLRRKIRRTSDDPC